MSIENRKSLRIGCTVQIELTLDDKSKLNVNTRNISDGGLFLILDDIEIPEIGTQVSVQLKNNMGDGEEPPITRAEVVRHEPNGIGLKFLD
ncbi:MAG: PilZ domain-containing protein [Gammaproteobacteria bacterium]|nr:PilZ domain-containing protein [Gammaproteobacteria bacterium]